MTGLQMTIDGRLWAPAEAIDHPLGEPGQALRLILVSMGDRTEADSLGVFPEGRCWIESGRCRGRPRRDSSAGATPLSRIFVDRRKEDGNVQRTSASTLFMEGEKSGPAESV